MRYSPAPQLEWMQAVSHMPCFFLMTDMESNFSLFLSSSRRIASLTFSCRMVPFISLIFTSISAIMSFCSLSFLSSSSEVVVEESE